MAKERALDFTGVEDRRDRFNSVHYPPGDYKGKILSVRDAKTKEEKKPMWVFTIQVKKGRYAYRCTFDPQSLWKIRNLFVAAGLNVPKKKVKANPDRLIGRDIGVSLDDDEYKDKLRSDITAVFPTSELGEDADDEDEEEGDDSDDDEDSDDSDDEDSEGEEGDSDDDEDEEPEPPKKKGKKKKSKKPADDEMEELDIEDI